MSTRPVVAALWLLAACGHPPAPTSAAAPGECRYPVEFQADPSLAESAEEAFDVYRGSGHAAAQADWDEALGTARSVGALGARLPDCADDAPLDDALWSALSGLHDFFPLDRTEWAPRQTTCGAARAAPDGRLLLRLTRVRLGAQPFEGESLDVGLVVDAGALVLDAVRAQPASGVLPDGAQVEPLLARCSPKLDAADLEARLRAMALPVPVFRGCDEAEVLAYRPRPEDPVTVEASTWARDPAFDTPVLRLVVRARLTAAVESLPADAGADGSCTPAKDGWVVEFDVVTGDVLAVDPQGACPVC